MYGKQVCLSENIIKIIITCGFSSEITIYRMEEFQTGLANASLSKRKGVYIQLRLCDRIL